MNIAKTIKKILIDKDMKQKEVAEKLEVSKQYFSNQLKVDNFRIDELVKICDILGYEVKLVLTDKVKGNVIEVNDDTD